MVPMKARGLLQSLRHGSPTGRRRAGSAASWTGKASPPVNFFHWQRQ
ncbi:MAG: hypothetical protein WDO13_06070 [Verrucomicrobiota bacterium]